MVVQPRHHNRDHPPAEEASPESTRRPYGVSHPGIRELVLPNAERGMNLGQEMGARRAASGPDEFVAQGTDEGRGKRPAGPLGAGTNR
jgi:hypothetical protein